MMKKKVKKMKSRKGAEIRVEDGPGSDANCRSLLGVKETKLESRMDLGLMLIVEAS